MSFLLNPWMRCECGKIHARRWISPTSICSCGRHLWRRAWGDA